MCQCHATVNTFYDTPSVEYGKKNFKANQAYNVDETGLTIENDERQTITIFINCKAERGSLVTEVCCMSAGIPLRLIFLRKNTTDTLLRGHRTRNHWCRSPFPMDSTGPVYTIQ